MKSFIQLSLITACLALTSCDDRGDTRSADQKDRESQERIQSDLQAQTGMPSIKNAREKRLLKEILELRDQEGLVTYTYIMADMSGKLIFLGQSIGYGIPAATQYTNPQKVIQSYRESMTTIAQADPNGLFSPASAEGTWVMLKNPHGNEVQPVYIEPRIIVSPFPLTDLTK